MAVNGYCGPAGVATGAMDDLYVAIFEQALQSGVQAGDDVVFVAVQGADIDAINRCADSQ